MLVVVLSADTYDVLQLGGSVKQKWSGFVWTTDSAFQLNVNNTPPLIILYNANITVYITGK